MTRRLAAAAPGRAGAEDGGVVPAPEWAAVAPDDVLLGDELAAGGLEAGVTGVAGLTGVTGVDTCGVGAGAGAVTLGVVTGGVLTRGVVTGGLVTLGVVTTGVGTGGTVTVGTVTVGTVTVGTVTEGECAVCRTDWTG